MNSIKKYASAFADVLGMELYNIATRPIYWFCMIIFPMFVIFFFTNIMEENLPTDMPVGLVDLDNSSTSRKLARRLDAFQNSQIVAHYPSVTEARKAMQKNEIYAFLYIPEGLSEDMIGGRQPKISFYYNNSILLAGSLTYKEMRAISAIGASGYTLAKMQKQGYTDKQIMTYLQPVLIDTHAIDNPWLNYNAYLCGTIIPASLALFICLMTAYTIGAEIKFDRSKIWLRKAQNSIIIALTGKMLPQTAIFSIIVWFYQYWLYIHLGFPHNCGFTLIMLIGLLLVLAMQGFGIFIFGIMPSLRMSLSICSLWSVLSFSISGFTFPLDAMDRAIQAISWLFPMRSYFMIYQMNIFHGYPVGYSWAYYIALIAFVFAPLLVLRHLKKVLNEFEYIP